VLAENQLMLNLLAELGRVRVLHREQGIVELIVVLPDSGIGHVRGLLGALAREDVDSAGTARAGARWMTLMTDLAD
jgi:hypothetical protein